MHRYYLYVLDLMEDARMTPVKTATRCKSAIRSRQFPTRRISDPLE